MPTYPFHPESRNTAIASCRIHPGGELQAGLVPCYIDNDARPVPMTRSGGGESVVEYIRGISRAAGLRVRLEWQSDDWVAVLSA